MKLSLVFSVLSSIIFLATAYPTQGATGIAKRSNERKRDSEELGVVDIEYQFNGMDYRKRGEGKRDSEELDTTELNYFSYDTNTYVIPVS
ncbi:hypothetical protein BDR04DRAFT_1232887 [Suillus decipiens]|nr:hypothetical protein BDR04DRAFT_1232887 [Suillus decipiens]